jgi:hypothetical protein
MNVGFNGRRDCLLPGLNHEFASCKDEFPLPLLEFIQARIFAVTLRSHVPMEYFLLERRRHDDRPCRMANP